MGSDEPSSFDALEALAAIPAELRALPRWVCWRLEPDPDGGKPKKIPVNPRTGGNAMINAPSTWGTFDEAATALQRHPAWAGLMLAMVADEDLVAIDLDGCVDAAGALSPAARDLVETFETYTEISPSGTGLHLLLHGRKPPGAGCKVKRITGIAQVEIYECKRFIAMTGRRVADTPETPQERQVELDDLCSELWPPKPEPSQRGPSLDGFTGDDAELLDKARKARNGDKFRRLYDHGDISEYGGDDSAADLALCSMLAFYTGPEPQRIDSLFRSSALYRAKWEREEYRRMTIDKALEGKSGYFGDDTPPRIGSDGQPLPIVQDGTDEHRVADEIAAHLANESNIYVRGGRLVQIVEIDGCPTILEISEPTLRELMTKHVHLQKRGRKDRRVAASPRSPIVKMLHARVSWPNLRPLSGIVRAPFLRTDGSVVQDPGYDEATRCVYAPTTSFPRVPSKPSQAEALAASRALLDVVVDFPFKSEAHRAGWLALVLSLAGRQAIAGSVPLFVIDANSAGAGKTLLAHIAGWIALGYEVPVSTFTTDNAEMRKMITSVLCAGDRMVLLDNLSGTVGNDALNRALTGGLWRDRALGSNDLVEAAVAAVVVATGNNVSVHRESSRRIIHIRLNSPLERPQDRADFKVQNLRAHVAAHHPILHTAALTTLAAFFAAGCPKTRDSRSGSFEHWADIIPQVLMWVGLPDPRSTRTAFEEVADTGRELLATLHAAWALNDPHGRGLVVSEVVTAIYPTSGDPMPSDDASIAMRAAFEALVDEPAGSPSFGRRVANRLKSFRQQVFEGRMLDLDPVRRNGGMAWRLVKVGP